MEFIKNLKTFVWSKHFLKHLGLVVLSYLLIVSIVVFYLDVYTNHGDYINVPNFTGKNINTIGSQIEELDLQYEVVETIYDPSKPEGTILSQDPRATAFSIIYLLKKTESFVLKFQNDLRLVEMPSLIDKSQSLC
jgi:eukaryotic-like serine/threonine-protein kinase